LALKDPVPSSVSDEFEKIRPEELEGNPFTLFGQQWPILTAGHLSKYNGMTIAWGGIGPLWRRKVVTVCVRPQRYTFQFLETEPHFSLSFLGESYRDALNYFGTKCGRDVDKARETGLTPIAFENRTVYFSEARLVLILNKLCADDFEKSHFVGFNPDEIYAAGDFHRFYVGEVVGVLRKKELL
jgi:hypothetical protein